MSDEYNFSSTRDLNCEIEYCSDNDAPSDDDVMTQLEEDIMKWLDYCRIAERIVRDYLQPNTAPHFLFPTMRCGHIFMLQNMHVYPQTCFQEFRMYPPMFMHFSHILRDEYGLSSSAHIDIYEQVGMFLCILAHGKGYRNVQTLFGHSLQTVCHYFKKVLRTCLAFAVRMIKPDPAYNEGVRHHHPKPDRFPMFQDCIGTIDDSHIRAVLPRQRREEFIGRKEIPTQNVLAVCDFNMCFTFVLPGTTGNAHDSSILARAVHSTDINFPEPTNGKYYLVDSGFAHRPGYMASYKGSDIRYHFQEFGSERDGRRRRFRNARERFNFHHYHAATLLSVRSGYEKQRWNILDRMPGYSIRIQVAVVVVVVVVVTTMAIRNFLRRNGQLDKGFMRAEEVDDDKFEVDLSDAEDEEAADQDAIVEEDVSWLRLRDYMAQALR